MRTARAQRSFLVAAPVALSVLLVSLSACGATTGPRTATLGATPTETPAELHMGVEVDLVDAFSTPNMLCAVPLIAVVTVATVGPSVWNPAYPGASSSASDRQSGVSPDPIITPVTFASMRVLLDHRSTATSQYAEHGGAIGSSFDHVDGYAGVTPGDTAVVIFMPGYNANTHQSDDGSTMYVTWAKPVDANGQIVLQQHTNEPGVGAIATITEPLSQLEQQLTLCH